METTNPIVLIVAALFGGGGLVSLVKALLDARNGKDQKEAESEVRYLLNRERRIAFLEGEREKDHRYIGDLIRALARIGAKIPDRRD